MQKILIPGAVIGIVIGALLFGAMSASAIRIILGIIAVTFTLNHWLGLSAWVAVHIRRAGRGAALVSAAIAGFTSFVAHAAWQHCPAQSHRCHHAYSFQAWLIF